MPRENFLMNFDFNDHFSTADQETGLIPFLYSLTITVACVTDSPLSKALQINSASGEESWILVLPFFLELKPDEASYGFFLLVDSITFLNTFTTVLRLPDCSPEAVLT